MSSLSYDERPARAPDTVDHPAGQGHIVHMRNAPTEVALNPTAFALWELCDGRTTVSEMVDAVCDLFEVTPHQARHDVLESIRHMRAVGILT